MPDSERMRARVLHGYAFRDLSPEELDKVYSYQKTGDPAALDGSTYRVIRDGMYARGER